MGVVMSVCVCNGEKSSMREFVCNGQRVVVRCVCVRCVWCG